MAKPIAVLISDIHFSVPTLELASASLTAAIDHAAKLDVPLVIAGDLTDGKALIRGEVANRLCTILQTSVDTVQTYVIVGNHDLLNEKGDAHALEYLKPYCNVVQSIVYVAPIGYLIPYQSSADALQSSLDGIPKGSRIIAHQGVQTAYMGHYVQDKTSLPKEAFADFRVISGHYHRAQDIKCGRPRKGAVGLFSYIGNPYTLTFGEAEDGPKGFQVLFDDGLLEQVELPMRRHRVIVREIPQLLSSIWTPEVIRPIDLLWLKITGTHSELAKLKKGTIGQQILGHSNFKLDLIPTDSEVLPVEEKPLTGEEIFDRLIAMTPESPKQKTYLQRLWREVI